jgi:hypothetical protein
VGLGAVVQSTSGEVMAALAKGMLFVEDPTVAKTWAALHVVNLCSELRLHRAMFEGDSLIVISALNKGDQCWSMYDQLIENIQTRPSSICSYEVRHVGREANKAAHCMTKFALTQQVDQLWKDECPSFLHSIVTADQADYS